MTTSSNTPIVIGVGDVVNRSKKIKDAIEPLHLMLQAIQKAIEDTGLDASSSATLQREFDSLDVVRNWTWPYPDLPSLISERLACNPRRKHLTEHGGNQPAVIFDEAARRISKGESKVALLTGGEALASLSACASAKRLPPPNWTPLTEEVTSVFSPTTRELKPSALPGSWKPPHSSSDFPDLGAKHSIGAPVQVYPLYENGFRAHRNQSVAENWRESSELYAEFAKVAEGNELAWNYGQGAETAEGIGRVGERNRMINFPYPLLMNAFNNVNLAAACILTSTEYARELGVPEEKWIYALGGAGTRDSDDFWERPAYWWSPAVSHSLDAGLAASGVRKEEVDLFDFYSCFPIVPKLACQHLGLPITKTPKQITLLGGLTSFGGAGNNYSMHAITEMTRQLRKTVEDVTKRRRRTGLVLANGGNVTYQHVICLSSRPRADGSPYPKSNPLPATTMQGIQVPKVEYEAEGEATIETYTVSYDRSNRPQQGYVVGRLRNNGHRFVANHADAQTLSELCNMTVEPIGRRGRVMPAPDGSGRNLFTLTSRKDEMEAAKL